MKRIFHTPSNIIQLNDILNLAQQNNRKLYYSDAKKAVYVISQINSQQNILTTYIGTNPSIANKIDWGSFSKNVVAIWEK